MEDLGEIKIEFLKDRLKKTSWVNRKYIQQLASLERVILKNDHNASIRPWYTIRMKKISG